MKFVLEFNMDTSAFVSSADSEMSYILDRVKQNLYSGNDNGAVYDSTGIKIGQFYICHYNNTQEQLE